MILPVVDSIQVGKFPNTTAWKYKSKSQMFKGFLC